MSALLIMAVVFFGVLLLWSGSRLLRLLPEIFGLRAGRAARQ